MFVFTYPTSSHLTILDNLAYLGQPHKKNYLKEIYNRLKPGGKFILVDIVGNKKSSEFLYLLNIWKQIQLKKIGDDKKIRETFEHIKNDLEIISEKKTMKLLKEIGFDFSTHFFKSLLINGYLFTKKL